MGLLHQYQRVVAVLTPVYVSQPVVLAVRLHLPAGMAPHHPLLLAPAVQTQATAQLLPVCKTVAVCCVRLVLPDLRGVEMGGWLHLARAAVLALTRTSVRQMAGSGADLSIFTKYDIRFVFNKVYITIPKCSMFITIRDGKLYSSILYHPILYHIFLSVTYILYFFCLYYI